MHQTVFQLFIFACSISIHGHDPSYAVTWIKSRDLFMGMLHLGTGFESCHVRHCLAWACRTHTNLVLRFIDFFVDLWKNSYHGKL